MNKALLSLLLLICSSSVFSQQFNLYNSRTLYDVFENPSQSAYQIDTSRKVAFNFFIPTLTINATVSGSANSAIKTLIYDSVVKGSDIIIGEHKTNIIAFNTNTYIAMLRLLHTVKKSQEIGLSWQIRNDGRIKGTNETLAIFDDYSLFFKAGSTKGFFNNQGYNQSYHQFSISYRKDVNKRMSIGAKGSVLSGITYTAFRLSQSNLVIDQPNNTMEVSVAGNLKSSFKFDNFESKALIPKFNSPGLALTTGASYKFRRGWFLMGTLKDVGFIKWNRSSYEYPFNAANIVIDDASNSSADSRLIDSVDKRIQNSAINRSYFSLLNGKMEVLINKNYGQYRPNLILSKSIYYEGADIVLTNNYHYRNLVLTASADYNTSKYLAFGGQFMIKSPNTEFFMGSDHLLKSIEMIRDARKGTGPYSAGYTGLSFYMGFGIKLGRILEHPANANFIPGINDPPVIKILKGISKKKDHL